MQNIVVFGMNLFEMFFYFCFWATVGWAIEVVDMTIETGEFQNRGFLNGPFCPIYGFGVLIVWVLLSPIQSIIALFITSTIVCTTVELLVGIGMQKLFHNRWWDYTNEKFNFKGYICLKNSLLFGGGCVIVIRYVQPFVMRIVKMIPYTVGHVAIAIIFGVIMYDLVISVCAVQKLNNRLSQMDALAKSLRSKKDYIGQGLSKETKELMERYNKLVEQTQLQQERLIKAFPKLKSMDYSQALEELKSKIMKNDKLS